MEYVRGCTGRIMWLPMMSDIEEHLRPQMDEEAHNHPAMVLSRQADENGRVKVLMLTSFGNQTLRDARPHPADRIGYLPILPSDEHPETGEQLRLGIGSPDLMKHSYINARGIHDVYESSLRSYYPKTHLNPFLDEVSYHKATNACGYKHPPLIEVPYGFTMQKKDLKSHGKGRKSLKIVDALTETGIQEKQPDQNIHPRLPHGNTKEDGPRCIDGCEGSGKVPTSVVERAGDEDFVSSPAQENTGHVNVDLGATLPLVEETLDGRSDVQAALTHHASDDGTVGTGRRPSDLTSSEISFSPVQASETMGPLRGTTSGAGEATPRDSPLQAHVSIWAKLLLWFRSL